MHLWSFFAFLEYLSRSLWLLEYPLKSLYIGLPLFVFGLFSLQPYHLSFVQLVFTLLCAMGSFFFVLVCLVFASCNFIGSSSFSLGKFSSMILLKIFPVPLTCVSLPSSIPSFCRFVDGPDVRILHPEQIQDCCLR